MAITTLDGAYSVVMTLILSHPFKAIQKLNNLTNPGGDLGFGKANTTVVVDDFS